MAGLKEYVARGTSIVQLSQVLLSFLPLFLLLLQLVSLAEALLILQVSKSTFAKNLLYINPALVWLPIIHQRLCYNNNNFRNFEITAWKKIQNIKINRPVESPLSQRMKLEAIFSASMKRHSSMLRFWPSMY